MFGHFLQWLEASPPAVAISESSWLFPGIESVHVLAIALVVGSITMVDLRLLGVALRGRPVAELTAEILPWTWSSFVVAACTGALMFSSNASHYWGTVPFRAKMLVLCLAGLNMIVFHATTYRSVELWGREPHTPPAAKVSGAISLLLWIGVVTLGRWIGFV
ncbi:MAG: hypothetical protein NVS1B6_04520 [Steroidobacteraceae bacterium]